MALSVPVKTTATAPHPWRAVIVDSLPMLALVVAVTVMIGLATAAGLLVAAMGHRTVVAIRAMIARQKRVAA